MFKVESVQTERNGAREKEKRSGKSAWGHWSHSDCVMKEGAWIVWDTEEKKAHENETKKKVVGSID